MLTNKKVWGSLVSAFQSKKKLNTDLREARTAEGRANVLRSKMKQKAKNYGY